MSGMNVNTAYSDDGQLHRRGARRNEDGTALDLVQENNGSSQQNNNNNPEATIHRRQSELNEPDTGVSITAELSDRRNRIERPDEDPNAAISERPDETDNASSIQGTIGEAHDIMSENIQSQFHQFRRVNGKRPQTVFQDHISESGVSKEVQKSTVTNKVATVAQVSEPVPLNEQTPFVQTFSLTYDRLFRNFLENLINEYGQMRGSYMGEYQNNFNQNTSRSNDKITEMSLAIESQESYIKDLSKQEEQQDSCLTRFLQMRHNEIVLRQIMKRWRYLQAVRARKRRLLNYTTNTIGRNKMRRLFTSWRGVTHTWFKESCDARKEEFRLELESKILVQWQTKVDSLSLYFAQLEDKIKMEQEAREKLTKMYDQSLLSGFNKLNDEVGVLSTNPLVHEVVIRKGTDE